MIDQQGSLDQLPYEIKPAFQELNVLKHLRGAGFKKKLGFTCANLFRLVFILLFHQKNGFRLLESSKGEVFFKSPRRCCACKRSFKPATIARFDQRNRRKSRQKAFRSKSASTPAMDCRFAQLHQGLSADFMLRKLSS